MDKLTGFIYYDNSEDKYTLWIAGLADEDRNEIQKILDKYENRGMSVRGGRDVSIADF